MSYVEVPRFHKGLVAVQSFFNSSLMKVGFVVYGDLYVLFFVWSKWVMVYLPYSVFLDVRM